MVMVEHLVAVGRDVVASEPPMPTLTPTPSGGTSIAKSTIISVVICVLFLLVCLCGYIHGHCRRVDDGSAAPGGGRASPGRGKRGLDQSVVATFPILPWRDHHKKEKRAMKEECCPVCLTAFEEDDNLRLLPHCSHVFHPECIDPWLQARETCPLCRANLEKPLPADAVAIPAEEAMELEMLRTDRRAARLLAEGS